MVEPLTDFEIELTALLEVLYLKFHQDFRHYSRSSLERRLKLALDHFEVPTLSLLQDSLMRDPKRVGELFRFITIPTTEMFRDPTVFLRFREDVIPILATYPSFKIWIAGCSTGEEVYSYAIVLRETGLLDRALIYATDVNLEHLRRAEEGVFAIDRIKLYTENYLAAGGRLDFSRYYSTAYDRALIDQTLKKQISFAEHSLATDQVFAEVDLVSCRNVFIYFQQELQDRATDLFQASLSRGGFLILGSQETLRFSRHRAQFETFASDEKIYRKSEGQRR